MADTKHLVVTREGLQKMKEELEYKETTEKMRIAEQLKVAISYGDLSENAEYDAAKNDQAALEQRINELKQMIENAVVVDESKIDKDTVGFGTRVTIIDLDDEDGEEEEYTIVGTSESDPVNGRLSNESPVGAALVGSHVGDTVVAQTPGGNRRLRIVSIDL
ncbi:MAG: transcription elongation factor GreA [Clostridiales bacterium]|nr:transcription elongation factor GreA [Clostridiales bacterium]